MVCPAVGCNVAMCVRTYVRTSHIAVNELLATLHNVSNVPDVRHGYCNGNRRISK